MVQSLALGSTARERPPVSLVWLVILFNVVFALAAVDQFVIFLLTPAIKVTLRVNDTGVSLLTGPAYGLCHAAAVLLFGWLADRTNRRNLLLIGIVGWSVATVACGFSSTFMELAAARIAMGMFQGALLPAGLSLIADQTPAAVRGRTIAIILAGGTVGAAGANFAGGGLLQLFQTHPSMQLLPGLTLAPWQSVFAACGAPGLLVAPLLLTLPEPARTSLIGGPRFGILAYLRENAVAFAPLFAASAFYLVAGYAEAGWAVVILIRNLNMSPAAAGAALGVLCLVCAALAATVGGWLSDLTSRRDPYTGRAKLLTALLTATSITTLLFLVSQRFPVIAACAIIALSGTMVGGLITTILSELTPSEGRGQVMALFSLIGILCGMGLAPTLVALITDHVLHDERRLPLSLVLVALPSLLLAAGLTVVALPGVRQLRRRMVVQTGET